MIDNWLASQRSQLQNALRSLRTKENYIITQPFFPFEGNLDGHEILYADDNHFRNHGDFTSDIYLAQGYQPDFAKLRYVRGTGRATLLATWFWDNHHLYADTMQAAMLSDVYFVAHAYRSAYIRNGMSLDGGVVPLCPIVWKNHEVEAAATQALLADRSALLYGGYNSYREFPERDVVIERIRQHIDDHNLFITPHGVPPEQHPFYGMTPTDRLLEWMKYKVSLCLSFGGNTAIRIFDMLLGGGIPLVVGRPDDLDTIFPRHVQDELPIIVIDDDAPAAVEAGYRAALARFDADGVSGVMRRFCFAKDNHMPENRMRLMIQQIRMLADRADDLDSLLGPAC